MSVRMIYGLFSFTIICGMMLALYSSRLPLSLKKQARVFSCLFLLAGLALLLVLVNKHHWLAKGKEFYTTFITDTEVSQGRTELALKMSNKGSILPSVKLSVPMIEQYPELPRGCEVTSLAMLFHFSGNKIDKLKLASEIKKNTASLKTIDGKVYYGDPNEGFVGDMYSLNNPGLGVYHKPIMELTQEYFDERAVDFTGQDFSQILQYVNDGLPIWVIINSDYDKLSDRYFETWHTSGGKIQVTRKEHSVVVTGYDREYIYFNDPLNITKKAPINSFREAWVQMGKQAITILKP
ncbi:C39 family peptidase [Halobacillus salinarum]|uniref:C39 family peptidase n=1 Tax=Halobacillus salinarum TaxID=2932257 RepID=A0ABY4ENQ1_9BACI|nr:C39 family peptidase [Halobacillus salinarum]UOQ46090.1 C39 family peptidase [Halobacillus salinarum]